MISPVWPADSGALPQDKAGKSGPTGRRKHPAASEPGARLQDDGQGDLRPVDSPRLEQ